MVSILSVGGYFVGANGGCQTPSLVISACTVAETALASTPPLSLLPHVRGNSMAHMPEARCTYASLSRPPAYFCARLDTSLWLPVFSPLALLRGFGFFGACVSLHAPAW